ncbi:MAG: PilN domain-containing protein [Planctomycetota bacterium]|jgi:hypothetical protein
MKEFDFLPEWYKGGRRRQISWRAQYAALGGIFVVMMVWNFIAGHSVSKAAAQLAQMVSEQTQAKNASLEFDKIKSQAEQIQEKANILEEIDSKIDVASVLAELSFLIDKKIVLSKVDFKAGKFANEQGVESGRGSLVRTARGNFGKKQILSLGGIRFQVTINGMAADVSKVAELVCRLEDSPYFRQVYPSFSRNIEIKMTTEVKSTDKLVTGSYGVSEFEIVCYLANYREK